MIIYKTKLAKMTDLDITRLSASVEVEAVSGHHKTALAVSLPHWPVVVSLLRYHRGHGSRTCGVHYYWRRTEGGVWADSPCIIGGLLHFAHGLPSACELSYITWIQAHRYVFMNYPHIIPFVEEHLNELSRNTKDRTPPQSLPEPSKKLRKFQAPLNKDDMENIKCGMEIGLTSPNSKKLVALGTVQKTDRKAKANDGQPLADYIEVLVSIVYKQTTILPRAHGKIQNLGSATARCIPWPRQNIICRDGSTPLHSKQVCSSISKITPNTIGTAGPKRLTSKADATRLDKGQVASQDLLEKKQAKRNVSKEKTEQLTSSKCVEGHKSNIHITTSLC